MQGFVFNTGRTRGDRHREKLIQLLVFVTEEGYGSPEPDPPTEASGDKYKRFW